MKKSVRTIGITFLLAAAWRNGSGVAQQAASIRLAPAFTADQLVALPRHGWLTAGGNLFNQRYSPLITLNRDNISQLKGASRTHLRDSRLEGKYSDEAAP